MNGCFQFANVELLVLSPNGTAWMIVPGSAGQATDSNAWAVHGNKERPY
jgi:hypothetical protein